MPSFRSATIVTAVLLLTTVAGVSAQQPASDVPSFRLGGGLIDVGVNAAPYRFFEPSTAVGFDLRVRWASPAALSDLVPLQPYFSLGPTFFVTDPDHVTRALDPHTDTTYGLGLRAGAGVTWTLDPNSTLFSEYHVTRGGGERFLPLGRSATDVSGYDLTYGVRLRF